MGRRPGKLAVESAPKKTTASERRSLIKSRYATKRRGGARRRSRLMDGRDDLTATGVNPADARPISTHLRRP